jgi:hypothetical protein
MRFAAGQAGALLTVAGLLSGSSFAAGMIEAPLAHLQGLDKTTARVSQFDAPVGSEVRFGTLSILVRTCQRSPPEEPPENAAFLEIFENRPRQHRDKLFSGWMFSSSPALSALEHSVYDVNLLECKGGAPAAPSAVAPPASDSPAAAPPGKKTGKSAR